MDSPFWGAVVAATHTHTHHRWPKKARKLKKVLRNLVVDGEIHEDTLLVPTSTNLRPQVDQEVGAQIQWPRKGGGSPGLSASPPSRLFNTK